MGYDTSFKGNVSFKLNISLEEENKTHETEGILEQMLEDNGLDNWSIGYEFGQEEVDINIYDSWKNHNDELEHFLYKLVNKYPDAEGWIDCRGDEEDDIWAIEVKDGRVEIISYELTEKDRQVWKPKKEKV